MDFFAADFFAVDFLALGFFAADFAAVLAVFLAAFLAGDFAALAARFAGRSTVTHELHLLRVQVNRVGECGGMEKACVSSAGRGRAAR